MLELFTPVGIAIGIGGTAAAYDLASLVLLYGLAAIGVLAILLALLRP